MFAYRERTRKPRVRNLRHAESRAANYDCPMDTDDELYLGAQLKRWRKAKGLTLDQLAADIDTSKGYLSQMERDKRPLSSRWLARVAKYYGTQVSEIIGAALPADEDAEIAEAADLIRVLKKRGKMGKVQSYLRFLEAEDESAQSPVGAADAAERPKPKERR